MNLISNYTFFLLHMAIKIKSLFFLNAFPICLKKLLSHLYCFPNFYFSCIDALNYYGVDNVPYF